MIVALIDNGSLLPAAHMTLRQVAQSLSGRTGLKVHPVSWKNSDRVARADDVSRAWTLAPFVRHHVARGIREFLFVPFFISAQGAIGSALRRELERLQSELGGFGFTFTDGLAARGVLADILVDRIRSLITAQALEWPVVIVVDHGGPSAESAMLRDRITAGVQAALGDTADRVLASSMEGAHPPLLEELLHERAFAGRDIVVATLFLAPGRHAGPEGDIAHICRGATARCHMTELVGNHPLVIDTLEAALRDSLDAAAVNSVSAPAGSRIPVGAGSDVS